MTVADTHTHRIKFPKQGEQASRVAVEAGKKHGGKANFYFVVPWFQRNRGWKRCRMLIIWIIRRWKIRLSNACFEENLPK